MAGRGPIKGSGKAGEPLINLSGDNHNPYISYAHGSQSLYVQTPAQLTGLIEGDTPPVLTPSVNLYHMIDNFETYSNNTQLATIWDTEDGGIFSREIIQGESMNMSAYNGLSFNAWSEGYTFVYAYFEDSNGNASEPMKCARLPKMWGRLDCPIVWGECDSTDVFKIYFYEGGDGYTSFYMDDIMVYDARTESQHETWTPILITALQTNRDSNTGVDSLAGRYGDIITYNKPLSTRGTFEFYTDFVSMDDDIRFLDVKRRRHTPMFLRIGGEGWIVRLNNINIEMQKNVAGLRNKVSMDFVEA